MKPVLACLGLLLVAGCGSAYEPPDPDDPQVVEDADQLARAVEADTTQAAQSVGDEAQWSCTAELWGRDGDALLGVADCAGTYADQEPSGFVTPVRVEDGEVSYAQDGDRYADSIRDLWGEEIAEAYLDE